MDQDVVHAVVDDVLPNGVVLLHHARDLELRADAVGRRDQYLVFPRRHLVESAERPDSAEHVLRLCLPNHGLDGLEGFHLVVNVDACGGVCRLGLVRVCVAHV